MQLRYFVAVAETMSFTDAAHRLHVSQPALSYQIKQLETELGARLLDRTSRRVSLSLDGRVFLPLARAVLNKADEALRVMRERLGMVTGEVAFGSISSVATHFVPAILAGFSQNYPGIRVHLHEGGTAGLERGVTDGSIDFAILGSPANPGVLEVTHLLDEELLLVVPKRHRLSQRVAVRLRELEKEDFIMLGPHFTLASEVKTLCRRAGFEPRVRYEVGSMESLLSFTKNGLGVAVVPRLALVDGRQSDDLAIVSFEEPLTRALNLVRGKDRYATVATRALMVHVRANMLAAAAAMTKPILGWSDQVTHELKKNEG
ncbi:MAG: LysR family transcriptional regulator [Gaiellales bacterium]|nr:LysR family transcriptional regulator [Gaiellales bacterium]